MKHPKLSVTIHINGQQVDKLTDEQKRKMASRLGKTMSEYYTVKPNEFKNLQNKEK